MTVIFGVLGFGVVSAGQAGLLPATVVRIAMLLVVVGMGVAVTVDFFRPCEKCSELGAGSFLQGRSRKPCRKCGHSPDGSESG
jgi:hypothetical protein